MATPRKLGRPARSDEQPGAFFDRVFDRQTGQLRIERRGPFWDAVATAARREGAGVGRLVAVIDYGFDLGVDELRRNIHPSSVTNDEALGVSDHHGTVVALLIRAVAPDVQLLLIDAWSVEHAAFPSQVVADAIRTARRLGADVINLSCEFATECPLRDETWRRPEMLEDPAPPLDEFLQQVTGYVENAEPYSGRRCPTVCDVCEALTGLTDTILVTAAAGNFTTAACPACVRKVVGTGFVASRRVEVDGRVVAVSNLARRHEGLPRYELLVDEPDGMDGTSFAAPLACGFGALLANPVELADMARLSWALQPVTGLLVLHSVTDPALLPDGAPSTVHQGLLRIADALPRSHRHFDDDMTTEPCGICALILVPWYLAFVAMLVTTGAAHHAAPIARISAVLAPDSAPIWGNYGLATRRLAEETSDPQEQAALRAEAQRAYARAVHLDPASSVYADGLASVH